MWSAVVSEMFSGTCQTVVQDELALDYAERGMSAVKEGIKS